jgi:biotin carboxyl carrier protein
MMMFGWIIFSATAIFTIAGAIKLIVDVLYKKKRISTGSSKVIEKYSINANVIRATVAGTVYKIIVVPGQQVREGDMVLIIKSMQMQIPVLAPAEAIVENVYVSIGDVLEKDMMVILLR